MSFIKQSVGLMLLGLSLTCSAQAQPPLKIGIAGPFSGPVAQYGAMQQAGAKAAIAHINEQGGIKGRLLEPVMYDDACEPKQAVTVANRIVRDKVGFVVGHLCSNATQPASDIYREENILVITGSTNPGITLRGYNNLFRTIGIDSEQGKTAVDYIRTQLRPHRVAIIHDKQQYGKGVAMIVKQGLEQAGIEIASVDGINSGEKDFSALVSKLKRANVDLVYYGGYHPELAQIMRQARASALQVTFMGPEGLGNKDIAYLSGEAVEGLLVTLPARYDLRAENQAITAYLQAQGVDSSGPFVWTSYAAVQALAQAMQQSDNLEPTTVADTLHHIQVKSVIGPISWDTHGDLQGFRFNVFQWHADGTGTIVSQ